MRARSPTPSRRSIATAAETLSRGAVVEHLVAGARGARPETPKPESRRRAAARVIGSRHDAMAGAAAEARARGYAVHVSDDPVVGEARTAAAARLAAASAAASGVPLCLISSGETTVRVTGGGRGGRNQEFALAAIRVPDFAPGRRRARQRRHRRHRRADRRGRRDRRFRPRSTRASTAGLSAVRYLDDNNAYAFFDALGDLIHTGPTGTNVGDLQVFLLA